MRGLQIIFYDRSIDFLRSYAPFNFFAGQREAFSNDALITAINEQNMTIYSNPYIGFPVTIDNEVFYGYRDILNRITDLDNKYEDIVSQELMFGSRTAIPVFEPGSPALNGSSLYGELRDQRIAPPIQAPSPEFSENQNRILALATPFGILGVPAENYVSRAYARQSNGFLHLLPMLGVSYNKLIKQSDIHPPPLTLENNFGLANPAKTGKRRLQKLNYSDYERDDAAWEKVFEGPNPFAIYQIAWDSWVALGQTAKDQIIREALVTPYVSNLEAIELAMTSPGDFRSYRDDLPVADRFRPWAAVERQRLLYGVKYDVRGTLFDYNFLEAFAKYSNWAQDELVRTSDYEELFVYNNDQSVIWGGPDDTGYSRNGIKALFDAEGTEWFFSFATTSMANAMIKWYNGDAALFNDEDDVGDMPFRERHSDFGAVLDKVGINHLYLKLAEASADIKPVVDRANLNSKINKRQVFYDKK